MTIAVIIASILLALWPPAYIACALRWPQVIPLPRYLAGWLEDIPWPRMPRIRKRGMHHADPLHVKLATTDTIPRITTPDRPPWNTQPFPEVTP